MELYRNHSSYAKPNAQRNLCGRTHYVDDDTLRWHKSRVISSRVVDNGLLFAIVTSDALAMDNSKRGFRYVIFDLFGDVISRVNLDNAYRTSEQATKAMWAVLNGIDAKEITREAISRAQQHFTSEMEQLRATVDALATKDAAAA